jgi:hypothetical protein
VTVRMWVPRQHPKLDMGATAKLEKVVGAGSSTTSRSGASGPSGPMPARATKPPRPSRMARAISTCGRSSTWTGKAPLP